MSRRPVRLAGVLRRHWGIGSGKAQRLWIVDVDGHRLMLVVGYCPGPEGPTRAVIKEMTQMAAGATFVDADQLAP